MFRIEDYLAEMERKINQILSKEKKEDLTYDILDSEFITKKNKLICLKGIQLKQKFGDMWQEVLGNYDSFQNLGKGHETGLDILSHTRKIAMELHHCTFKTPTLRWAFFIRALVTVTLQPINYLYILIILPLAE